MTRRKSLWYLFSHPTFSFYIHTKINHNPWSYWLFFHTHTHIFRRRRGNAINLVIFLPYFRQIKLFAPHSQKLLSILFFFMWIDLWAWIYAIELGVREWQISHSWLLFITFRMCAYIKLNDENHRKGERFPRGISRVVVEKKNFSY